MMYVQNYGRSSTDQPARRDTALRGRVDVATAAAEFGTAEMTVRRDLDVLVERGVARRVRGGAVNLMMRGEELPFAMRELDALDPKKRIASDVAGLIADGEAVGLDSGTTVLEIARVLARGRLTVMPLSLHAAMALSGSVGRYTLGRAKDRRVAAPLQFQRDGNEWIDVSKSSNVRQNNAQTRLPVS